MAMLSPPAKSKDYSFWWTDCIKLLHKFKEISTCSLKDGSTILLWKDNWNDQPLQHTLTHLASYARLLEISVHNASLFADLTDLFHIPLSEIAYVEFIKLYLL
jgi:hypothetical protein